MKFLVNQEEKTIPVMDGSDNISLLQTEACFAYCPYGEAAPGESSIVHQTLQVQLPSDTHKYRLL